ncbi:MarR family winged helix-turn-helix transcriptional regulator [Metabacillus sp. RGM 3146]|uniref:MarR family winged helix-turn-helix transcriptional regulator n=1 Tax=Metabacillus sp. RGM 3146 TaxID=3401092 RepID=UPI003B9D27A7
MNKQVDSIAQNFVLLLPLIYNKLSDPSKKSTQEKKSELTHLQTHLLDVLSSKENGVSMTGLAQQINISKQQLTPLITKLEEKLYVKKEPDPNDKRAVKIKLADKGKEAVYEQWSEMHHLFISKISTLEEEDIDDLNYALGKVVRIFGKLE